MIPKQAVIAACEAYLAARKKRIEARREKLIEQKMTGFAAYKSREAAIASLNRDGHFSEWHMAHMFGAIPAQGVENLLKLAHMAPDTVMVDDEGARLIDPYFEKEASDAEKANN
jgi:hypothetical protein